MIRVVLSVWAVVLAGCEVSDQILVRNASGADLDRVTVTVADETVDLGPLADGASGAFTVVPERDASVEVCVDRGGAEACQAYGYVTPNLAQRHAVVVGPEGVRYTSD